MIIPGVTKKVTCKLCRQSFRLPHLKHINSLAFARGDIRQSSLLVGVTFKISTTNVINMLLDLCAHLKNNILKACYTIWYFSIMMSGVKAVS